MIRAFRPEEVVTVWRDAEPELRRACERTGERTTHDVLCQLVTGNAQLWRVDECWMVTEIATYPRKRVAFVSLCGGKFPDGQMREMREMLYQWAKHYQADEIRIVGRRGWLRYLPDFHEMTVLTCQLQAPCSSHQALPVQAPQPSAASPQVSAG